MTWITTNKTEAAFKALVAIKDFLEWGAKTGSDRELFDDRFRSILDEARISFKEPSDDNR